MTAVLYRQYSQTDRSIDLADGLARTGSAVVYRRTVELARNRAIALHNLARRPVNIAAAMALAVNDVDLERSAAHIDDVSIAGCANT
jgi:hypothetical protein